jgi:predicted DNA-binding transcriptional regulator YafY
MIYSADGKVPGERTVDPLGLVAKGSVWYLVAQTPRGLRTYRVSRIQKANVLDQPCERPHDFDLVEYWNSSTAQFRDRPRYKVTLRLEPQTAETVKAWGCFSAAGAAHDDPDGWTIVHGQFDDEDHACFMVLGLGPRADVIEPKRLRDRLKADISNMIERLK